MVTGQSSIFFAARAAAARVERTDGADSEVEPLGTGPPVADPVPSGRAAYFARAERRVSFRSNAMDLPRCSPCVPCRRPDDHHDHRGRVRRHGLRAFSSSLPRRIPVLSSILVLVGQGLLTGLQSILR